MRDTSGVSLTKDVSVLNPHLALLKSVKPTTNGTMMNAAANAVLLETAQLSLMPISQVLPISSGTQKPANASACHNPILALSLTTELSLKTRFGITKLAVVFAESKTAQKEITLILVSVPANVSHLLASQDSLGTSIHASVSVTKTTSAKTDTTGTKRVASAHVMLSLAMKIALLHNTSTLRNAHATA